MHNREPVIFTHIMALLILAPFLTLLSEYFLFWPLAQIVAAYLLEIFVNRFKELTKYKTLYFKSQPIFAILGLYYLFDNSVEMSVRVITIILFFAFFTVPFVKTMIIIDDTLESEKNQDHTRRIKYISTTFHCDTPLSDNYLLIGVLFH